MKISNEITEKNSRYKEIRTFLKKSKESFDDNISNRLKTENVIDVHQVDKIDLFKGENMFLPYDEEEEANAKSNLLIQCF